MKVETVTTGGSRAHRGRTAWHSRWLCAGLLALFPLVCLFACGAQAAQEKPSPAARPAAELQDIPAALPHGKKLILKDGTFHIAREYEPNGERVRFYSVERSAWEEIPASLVDWDATRKAEQQEQQRNREQLEKLRATEMAERVAELEDLDASIQVAPGVFLPAGEGLFAVEGQSVRPLSQSGATIKLDKSSLLKQVVVPVPVVPTKRKVQIPGKKAAARLATARPEFYMRTADAREPEMELVRTQAKGDTRTVETLSTGITGTTSARNSISIERWKIARGVYRFTLSQALEPGEYALAEILPDGMNLFVWDFGVEPAGKSSAPSRKSDSQAQPKSSRRDPQKP